MRLQNCVFHLYSKTEPIIETSSAVAFGPFNGAYAEHAGHMAAIPGLDVDVCFWWAVFDFSDEAKTGANWRLLSEGGRPAPWALGEGAPAVCVPYSEPGSAALPSQRSLGGSSGGAGQVGQSFTFATSQNDADQAHMQAEADAAPPAVAAPAPAAPAAPAAPVAPPLIPKVEWGIPKEISPIKAAAAASAAPVPADARGRARPRRGYAPRVGWGGAPKRTFAVGQRVEAKFGGKATYYAGKITSATRTARSRSRTTTATPGARRQVQHPRARARGRRSEAAQGRLEPGPRVRARAEEEDEGTTFVATGIGWSAATSRAARARPGRRRGCARRSACANCSRRAPTACRRCRHVSWAARRAASRVGTPVVVYYNPKRDAPRGRLLNLRQRVALRLRDVARARARARSLAPLVALAPGAHAHTLRSRSLRASPRSSTRRRRRESRSNSRRPAAASAAKHRARRARGARQGREL